MEGISQGRVAIIALCRNAAVSRLSFYEIKFEILKYVLRNRLVERQ